MCTGCINLRDARQGWTADSWVYPRPSARFGAPAEGSTPESSQASWWFQVLDRSFHTSLDGRLPVKQLVSKLKFDFVNAQPIGHRPYRQPQTTQNLPSCSLKLVTRCNLLNLGLQPGQHSGQLLFARGSATARWFGLFHVNHQTRTGCWRWTASLIRTSR